MTQRSRINSKMDGNELLKTILNSKVADLNPHLKEALAGVKKKSKFRNTPTKIDGEHFDSKGEADRWKELLWQRKTGLIGNLKRQVRYELNEGGEFSFVYVADYVYQLMDTGAWVVEDYKGTLTREYKKKKKLMKKIYGIEIVETKHK